MSACEVSHGRLAGPPARGRTRVAHTKKWTTSRQISSDPPDGARSGANRAPPAWERNFVNENERHAAWERFAKMKNESHAAWERVCCPYGPG